MVRRCGLCDLLRADNENSNGNHNHNDGRRRQTMESQRVSPRPHQPSSGDPTRWLPGAFFLVGLDLADDLAFPLTCSQWDDNASAVMWPNGPRIHHW